MSRRQYDEAAMEAAIVDFQQNGGNLRATAKKYGVPKSTLSFKLKNPGHKETFGPRPVLNIEEENILVNWITQLARKGFPKKKEDLKSSVQTFLTNNPRPNPFTNNRPGDGWIKAFLKRHPSVVQRTSEAVTSASSCVSEKDIRKWFQEIAEYMSDNKLESVIQDPSRIFNGDETAFQICPSTGKVLASKGEKNVYSVEHGASKENLTVMFTFSANGKTCPPMIIYGYKRIPEKITLNVPNEWGIAKSDNGWMTSEVFFEYIANIFHPYLIKENIELPVIYFLDGHKTHLTYEVSKLCSQLKIELIALYPNATRILQPADVAVFRPIKLAWKKAVREWCNEHINEVVTKLNFASILKNVVPAAIKPETLINGFRLCGLYPFDVENVDFSKCIGKTQQPIETKPKDISDNSIITYGTFANIVGQEKINKFRNIKSSNIVKDDNNENFFLLYNIWQSFQNVTDARPEAKTAANHKEVTCRPDKSNLPQVHRDECLDKLTDKVEKYGVVDENQMEFEIQGKNNQQSNQAKEIEVVQEVENQINISTPAKQQLSVESPAFKVVNNNSSFGKYLVWPKTPERKGKRETERFPYAITSEKYKKMFKAKNEKKRKIEEEKIERKKKRDEKRKSSLTSQANSKQTKKENSSKANSKQNKKENSSPIQNINVLYPSTSKLSLPVPANIHAVTRALFNNGNNKKYTNACEICKQSVSSQHRLVCDDCSKIYHKTCIPKRHQMHIPDDIDSHLFVCHICYQECSSSEDGDMQDPDGSDDEEELFAKYTEFYKNH